MEMIGDGRRDHFLQRRRVGMQPNLAAGGEDVEHRAGVVTAAHGQCQIRVAGVRCRASGVVGAGEAVHRVECQLRVGVGLADGEVEDAAAADRRQLVPVTEQREAHVTLIRHRDQGTGGVLVGHAGFIDHEQVTRPKPRRLAGPGVGAAGGRVGLPDGEPGPAPFVVPAPAVLEGQPRRRSRRRAHLGGGDFRRLQGRGDHYQPAPLSFQYIARGGEGGGLARPGRALDDDQWPVAGQRGDCSGLAGIQLRGACRELDRSCQLGIRYASDGAGGEPGRQLGLHGQHRPRGPGPDVLGHTIAIEQRHAPVHGACGEVLGQLDAHRGLGHDSPGGDQPLDLAADVRGVPRRPGGGQPDEHPLHRLLAVQGADGGGVQIHGALGVAVTEVVQLGPPAFPEVRPGPGGDLVRAAVGPGAGVPCAAQRRPGVFAGMRRRPLPLVAVHVPRDLRIPRAERTRILRELQYFSSRVPGVAVHRKRGVQVRITCHRGVPHAIDGREGVPHINGVQAAPFSRSEHPGQDLQVQMPMRVLRAGGVVPHRRCLQDLQRHLHLAAPRADAGGCVLREPGDDLLGGPFLRRLVGPGDVRVQRGGQRPGLRAVDHHLDEPHRMRVAAQLTPRLAGVRVPAGDPGLVGIAGQRRQLGHPTIRGSEALGDARALGEVIVIGPAPVGLHVMPRSLRCAGVDLHSAVHLPTPPNNDQHVTPINATGPREAGPELPLKVVCVPHFWIGRPRRQVRSEFGVHETSRAQSLKVHEKR